MKFPLTFFLLCNFHSPKYRRRSYVQDRTQLIISIAFQDIKYHYFSMFRKTFYVDSLKTFFGIEGPVALERNPGPEYNTLFLRLIPGDLLYVCPHKQFHTLPGLFNSRATLSNHYPNACVPSREAICTIFIVTYRMNGGHANH